MATLIFTRTRSPFFPHIVTSVWDAVSSSQREDAIARHFDLMEWTFDPLEIKNAYLNIARLGAIVRRYLPNFYGLSSSPLQGGLPTDRLYAECWLRSPRVTDLSSGKAPSQKILERISVPHTIYHWKQAQLWNLAQSLNESCFMCLRRYLESSKDRNAHA